MTQTPPMSNWIEKKCTSVLGYVSPSWDEVSETGNRPMKKYSNPFINVLDVCLSMGYNSPFNWASYRSGKVNSYLSTLRKLWN